MAKKNHTIFTDYRESFVTVFPTSKNIYHEQGKPFEVHPDYAKHLINKGMAQETKPEPITPEEEAGQGEGAAE